MTRNEHGVPGLDRRRHVNFLVQQLGRLPGAYKSADPSRPWLFYWCLSALALLGEDVASYGPKLVETTRPMQNATGGFAGGFGQTSHLATTYATVLALALVGGEDAYELVDRRSMWKWLGSLKQPDGGFQMALGGEEDVRYVCRDGESFSLFLLTSFSCRLSISIAIALHFPHAVRRSFGYQV
jgi:protein farnesyltransferase subunit beta